MPGPTTTTPPTSSRTGSPAQPQTAAATTQQQQQQNSSNGGSRSISATTDSAATKPVTAPTTTTTASKQPPAPATTSVPSKTTPAPPAATSSTSSPAKQPAAAATATPNKQQQQPATNNNTVVTSPNPSSPPPQAVSSGDAAATASATKVAASGATAPRSQSRGKSASNAPTRAWGPPPALHRQSLGTEPTKKVGPASARVVELASPKKHDEREMEKIEKAMYGGHVPVKRTASPEHIEHTSERLYSHSQEQNKWRAQKLEEREKKEMAEVRARPEVTSHVKKMPERTPDQFLAAQAEWAAKRERKLAKIREKTEKEQESVVEQVVATLPHSKAILEAKTKTQDQQQQATPAYVPCTDYITQVTKKNEHLQKLHEVHDPKFKPVVRSDTFKRRNSDNVDGERKNHPGEAAEGEGQDEKEQTQEEKDVAKRLYEQALKQKAQREAAAAEKKKLEEQQVYAVQPKLVRKREEINNHLNDMFQRIEISALKNETKQIQNNIGQAMEESFSPFVTERSKLLAEKHRMRKLREYQEQLLKSQEEEQLRQQQLQQEGEDNHQGGSNQRSSHHRRENLSAFFQRNEKLLAVRRECERTKEELDFEREGKHCTFSPEINRAPRWAARVDSGGDVFSRLTPQFQNNNNQDGVGRNFLEQQGNYRSGSTRSQQQQQLFASQSQPRNTSPSKQNTSIPSLSGTANSYDAQFALYKEVQASLAANSPINNTNYGHRQANQTGYSNPNSPYMRKQSPPSTNAAAAAAAQPKSSSSLSPSRNNNNNNNSLSRTATSENNKKPVVNNNNSRRSASQEGNRSMTEATPKHSVTTPLVVPAQQQKNNNNNNNNFEVVSFNNTTNSLGGDTAASPVPKQPQSQQRQAAAAAPASTSQQRVTAGGGFSANSTLSGYQSALDEWKALEAEAEALTAGIVDKDL